MPPFADVIQLLLLLSYCGVTCCPVLLLFVGDLWVAVALPSRQAEWDNARLATGDPSTAQYDFDDDSEEYQEEDVVAEVHRRMAKKGVRTFGWPSSFFFYRFVRFVRDVRIPCFSTRNIAFRRGSVWAIPTLFVGCGGLLLLYYCIVSVFHISEGRSADLPVLSPVGP